MSSMHAGLSAIRSPWYALADRAGELFMLAWRIPACSARLTAEGTDETGVEDLGLHGGTRRWSHSTRRVRFELVQLVQLVELNARRERDKQWRYGPEDLVGPADAGRVC